MFTVNWLNGFQSASRIIYYHDFFFPSSTNLHLNPLLSSGLLSRWMTRCSSTIATKTSSCWKWSPPRINPSLNSSTSSCAKSIPNSIDSEVDQSSKSIIPDPVISKSDFGLIHSDRCRIDECRYRTQYRN